MSHPFHALCAEAVAFATLLVLFAHVHLVIAVLGGITWFCFLAVMNWAQRR